MQQMQKQKNWQDFYYSASDGLKLAGRKYGWNNKKAFKNTPVVCLSATTQNSSEFHELATALSTRQKSPRRVLALDYRGRGLSDYDKSDNYNVLQEADDTLCALMAANIQHVNMIGSARGGLVIMNMSAMRPTIINSVILNDIGPAIDARGLVKVRTNNSLSNEFSDWKSATEFLQHVGKVHFPKFTLKDWERQAKRQFTLKDDKLIRDCDIAILDSLNAIDLDHRIPELWNEFTGLSNIALMLIHGENSNYLAKETISKMLDIHNNMAVIDVSDQGHTPDLATDNLPEKIAEFLNRQN